MTEVMYTDLIIACESCGEVKKFTVSDQNDANNLFDEYHCPNGCGRQLYSFITLGTLKPPEDKPTTHEIEVADD